MVRDHLALHRYLAERSRLPFGGEREWESCARFAARAVAAQTGTDPLTRLAEGWTTELQAASVIARAGGLAEAVSTVLTEIPPGLAQRGDVGFVPADTPAGGVLVIVEGHHVVGPAANGVRRLPRAAVTRAWRAA